MTASVNLPALIFALGLSMTLLACASQRAAEMTNVDCPTIRANIEKNNADLQAAYQSNLPLLRDMIGLLESQRQLLAVQAFNNKC